MDKFHLCPYGPGLLKVTILFATFLHPAKSWTIFLYVQCKELCGDKCDVVNAKAQTAYLSRGRVALQDLLSEKVFITERTFLQQLHLFVLSLLECPHCRQTLLFLLLAATSSLQRTFQTLYCSYNFSCRAL